MLEPKQALTKALGYFAETFPDASNLSLESLSLSDDKNEWITTLSFKKKRREEDASSLELLLSSQSTKEIRTIKINANTGKFIALESPNLKK